KTGGVARCRGVGAIFVHDLDDVPEGAHLLYSAHGVSPAVRELARRRRLETVDATCPLVTKVHLEAVRFARSGYTIVLIGHRGHDEVVGTMGEAPDRMVLVQSERDIDRLNPPTSKLAYLTQTTLSVDHAGRLIARLKERFPSIVGPPKEDICYATQNRQEGVRVLAREVEVALVVGSSSSANSQRLAEIAAGAGAASYLIDGAADIDEAWFRPDDAVLLTAGASAPECAVQECVYVLCRRFNAVVDPRVVRHESVDFLLPGELRRNSVPVSKETGIF